MATLIAIYGAQGECLGRCDARCYAAELSPCDCICGGLNHGAGHEQAIQNTSDCAERWLSTHEHQTAELFGKPFEQLPLF